MYICSDNQERDRVSELTFKMCKSLIKHMCIIFHSHVYNIVFEVDGVKKCKKGSYEASTVIETREPWSPGVATWRYTTAIALPETNRKDRTQSGY